MIIKGKARGRPLQLAQHLLRRDENEQVELLESKGTIARDIDGALIEMETRAKFGSSRRSLYHASISPEPSRPLTREQLDFAVEKLESRLGLAGQPRLVVRHVKKGREHFHVVWSRIGNDTKAIHDSWNYVLHEQVARELEQKFGHPSVAGSRDARDRRVRPRCDHEQPQVRRSKRPLSEIEDELRRLWGGSGDASEFQRRIEAAGYQLARGDRRGFVVVDARGEVHSLSRRLGLSKKELIAKLPARLKTLLPDVKTARQRLKPVERKLHVNVSSPSMVNGFSSLPVQIPMGTSRRTASLRASIRSEYARRMSAACESGTREEIGARLRQLKDEETVSLDALAQETGAAQAANTSLRGSYRAAAAQVTGRGRGRRVSLNIYGPGR